MDRGGVFGHSFGGAASIQACSTDSRCKAAVDLDGSVYGSVLNDGAQRPIMFLMGDPVLMPNLPGFRGSRERTERAMARDNRTIGNILNRSPEGYKFRVHGLWHKDYTDFALFFDPPSTVARIIGNEVNGQRGLRIVTTYLRQFFDKSLSGARAPLIDDGNTAYTEVQVEYVAHSRTLTIAIVPHPELSYFQSKGLSVDHDSGMVLCSVMTRELSRRSRATVAAFSSNGKYPTSPVSFPVKRFIQLV